jgi:5-methylcytosine-specific restriction endonuclease McrA
MKNPSVPYAKQQAWTALSKFVRARDPRCVTCGYPTTEAGHYRHNSDKANKQLGGNELWYDERNINGQCMRCNRYFSGRLDRYSIYLEEKYGKGILQKLNKSFLTPRKWTVDEILKVAENYKKKLEELQKTWSAPVQSDTF